MLTVDASPAILAVHVARDDSRMLSHTIAGAAEMRSFAANLTNGRYAYGSTVNAGFVLDTVVRPNLQVELEFLLSTRAATDRVVILVPLHIRVLPRAYQFQCSNHVFVTDDESVLLEGRSRGLWICFQRRSLIAVSPLAYHLDWQFVTKILLRNYSVIIADASDPTPCYLLRKRAEAAVTSSLMLPIYLPARTGARCDPRKTLSHPY